MRLLPLEPQDLVDFDRVEDMEMAKEFLKDHVKLVLYTGGREIYEVTEESDLLNQKNLFDMKVISKFELYID